MQYALFLQQNRRKDFRLVEFLFSKPSLPAAPVICSIDVASLSFLMRLIISESTGPILVTFSGLLDIRVMMINLTFVQRSLEGCGYGNQFLV